EGFFQHPPEPKYDGSYISFPIWPESRYLARVAHVAPQLVRDTILEVPETDNARVHEDFADAACAMPPELAAEWAARETTWVSEQDHLYMLLPQKLGALVSHLARGGQPQVALSLARALLTIPPGRGEDREVEESYRLPPEPRPRMDSWDYDQIMKDNIPDLVVAAGTDAFDLLCDLLETAVGLSLRPDKRSDSNRSNTLNSSWAIHDDDYSYIWRPAIEEHEQNQHGGLRNTLISAVRDAGERVIERDRAAASEIVRKLEARRFLVFHRIALHFLRKFPEATPDLVADRLTDRRRFDDAGLRHEYYLLARDCFGRLTEVQKQQILTWIGEGPSRQWLEAGEPPRSDAERAVLVKHWQRDRLEPLEQYLDTKWLDFYQSLVNEVGRSEHPEFILYSSGLWVGPTSPKTGTELSAMSIDEIVSLLRNWQPSDDLMDSSPEGLGRQLKAAVALQPDRFANKAEQFKGLDPTYVRSLLAGLRDAIDQDRVFPWPAVLNLCRWTLQQPRDIPGRSDWEDRDPGWVWARKTVADLLGAGFEDKPAEMPVALRTEAWDILHPLTDDPEPTPEYEGQYGGSNMDPATVSINTVRGVAMHSLVKYALWLRRHFEQEPDGKERLARGFDEMPEVRELLERHLDPKHDPSLAIRAFYGQWFPWLNLLDPRWVKENLQRIYPQDDGLAALRDTAWATYISFCHPYNDVLAVLREEYARAVQRIGALSGPTLSFRSPDEGLALHLMTLYGRGKLKLDKPDGLIQMFYSRAPDGLCGHAIKFIGQSLGKTQGRIRKAVLRRFMRLWEWRMEVIAKAATPDLHVAELAAFGSWFVSGKFDDAWAIAHLRAALELAGRTEPDHLVVDRLAQLTGKMPLIAVQCLRMMVEGDKEGWHIHMWKDSARGILRAALSSSDGIARREAEDLVNRLGALGHYATFRDLVTVVESQ
ncbi:MAG: hypothetical protein ACUVX1_17965, partial [Chloroflexota bacterium]